MTVNSQVLNPQYAQQHILAATFANILVFLYEVLLYKKLQTGGAQKAATYWLKTALDLFALNGMLIILSVFFGGIFGYVEQKEGVVYPRLSLRNPKIPLKNQNKGCLYHDTK